MVGYNNGIIDFFIDNLFDCVDLKYEFVIYVVKCVCQINDYYFDLYEGNFFDNVGLFVDLFVEDKLFIIVLYEINEDKFCLCYVE